MPAFAIGIDLALERIEVVQHRRNARLGSVGAIAVGPAAVIGVGSNKDGPINTLVAPLAAKGLDFTSTHPDSTAALAWMGFEARAAIGRRRPARRRSRA
jgi:hypothetical protein